LGSYAFVLARESMADLVPPLRIEHDDSTLRLVDNRDRKIKLHTTKDFTIEDDKDKNIRKEDWPQDHSVVFDLGAEQPSEPSALDPDTRYYYEVISHKEIPTDGEVLSEDRFLLGDNPSFLTLPDDPNRLDFAFYSCHKPFDGGRIDVSMWDLFLEELRRRQPQFVFGGGDLVYVDGEDSVNIWHWLAKVKKHKPTLSDVVSWYRDIYRGYWDFKPVQAMFANYPNYMIWDDHEIMDGWGSYTESELADILNRRHGRQDPKENLRQTFMMRDAAGIVYADYQHSHNTGPWPPEPDPSGESILGFPLDQGGCDFYVLDIRGHKQFDAEHDFRVLGKSQHERLAAWAKGVEQSANRGPIFIVSPVPVVHLRNFVIDLMDRLLFFDWLDDVRDHWEHAKNHKEITRLLDLLFGLSDTTRRPLVVLSGDAHIGAVFSVSHPEFPKACAFQVTSSAITYATLNDAKLAGLAMLVKKHGKVGKTDVTCKNHFICPQHNFSFLSVRTDTQGTKNVWIELMGKSPRFDGMPERHTVDLLDLIA